MDDLLNIFATFPFFIFRKVDVLWTALSPHFAQTQCNLVSFMFISTIIKSGKFVSVTFHQAMKDQKWCSWLMFLSCYWCLVCEEPLPSLIVGFIRDRVENQAGYKRRSESLSNCKKTERQSQTAIRYCFFQRVCQLGTQPRTETFLKYDVEAFALQRAGPF